MANQPVTMPLENAQLETNLDANAKKIVNANLVDYAGANITWNSGTGKFDSSGGGGGSGPSETGLKQLVIGQPYIDVTFAHTQTDTSWKLLDSSIVNTVDANAFDLWSSTMTNKTTTGFRAQLNGSPDTNNYTMEWAIAGAAIGTTVATTYTLTGPSSGEVLVASTNFTVALPINTTVPSPVTITPSDGGGGGSFFAPVSPIILTTASPSATFIYTPATTGAKTISTTNSGGLTNPGNLTYTSNAAAPHLLNTLISYWKMDEAPTSSRADSVGRNNWAETAGTVGSFAAKINNGAYASGGAGQPYLSIASNSTLRVTSDFTFSLWVRVDEPTVQHVILSKNTAGFSPIDYLIEHDPALGFAFQAGGVTASVGSQAGAFSVHHIVAWFDSGDSKLRMRIDDTTTYTSAVATLTQGTDPLAVLAASYGNLNWNGLVDEIGFWKRKLTSSEITALYNGGAGLPFSSFTT